MEQQQQTALAVTAKKGVVQTFAERFDVDAAKVMSLVANTVFRPSKDEPPLSNEETAAALIVCNAYDLNPFTKEIYAFRSQGKLLIVVGVDGWSVIVNRQQQLNGIEFEEHFDEKGVIRAVTCKIHRKDCALPIMVTEYTHECKRNTKPWQDMPIRMTRNRAFVQCARIAFSISGIVDDDEARTIDGNPEFAGKAIIDAAPSKKDAVRDVVRAQAGKKKDQPAPQQAEREPAQEEDTTSQSTAQADEDSQQHGTQEQSSRETAASTSGQTEQPANGKTAKADSYF